MAALLEGYLAHLRQPTTVPPPELRPLPPEACAGPPSSRFRGRLATWLRPRRLAALGALAALGVCLFLLLQTPPPPQQQPSPTDVYCDFRGGRPLPPSFTLQGPDADKAIKREEEGLRITLPATRRSIAPVAVATTSPVAGDFEITGTYELLSADRPPGGNGVGVALNIATDYQDMMKFAKVGRILRAQEGDVYKAESWIKGQPDSGQQRFTPTTARAGKLRFVREGSTLRFLVADGPEHEFREINRREFTTEDLKVCRFVANNNGSPAGLDARLIDLRIRSDHQAPYKPLDREAQGWFAGHLVVALGFSLALLCALCVLLHMSRRARVFPSPGVAGTGDGSKEKPGPAAPEAAAPFIVFACPGCGKKLRARPALAGKSLKCPQCGQGVLIPGTNPGSLAPRASTGRFSILKNRGVVASVLVLAVVAGVCSWLFWPWRDKYSFLNGTLGSQVVPEVQESGLYYQESDEHGNPFRWTNGKGRLVIPIDRRKPPTGLVLKLEIYRPAGVKTVRVQIVANNRELVEQEIALGEWEGSSAGRFPLSMLDLTGIDLGDELVLDMNSDTFVSPTDQRTLGVLVRGIEVLHLAPAPP